MDLRLERMRTLKREREEGKQERKRWKSEGV